MRKIKPSVITVFALFISLCSIDVYANPYGFNLGISTEYTVTSGSVVSVDATLTNTGDNAIIFAPNYTGWLNGTGNYARPSEIGGGFPSGGFSNTGDWLIIYPNFHFGPYVSNASSLPYPLSDYGFMEQFAGKTILPGEALSFVFGNFITPNAPLGSSGYMEKLYFELWLTDTIYGGVDLLRTGQNSFSLTGPTITFTIGDTAAPSPLSYFEANVYNINEPYIGGSPVPEPATILLFGAGIASLAAVGRRKRT